MTWLRVDDDFPQNPKVAALTDREFRQWIRLLCWCAKFKTAGDIPDYALRELGVSSRCVSSFVELGLLDREDEGLTVHDWHLFNPPSGSERQKRYRDRRKGDVTRDVTGDVTSDGESDRALARARVPVPVGSSEAKASSRKPDELWDACVRVVDGGAPVTKSERGRWNHALKEIRDAEGTEAQMEQAAKEFRRRYPGAALTPTALSTNWGSLLTSANGASLVGFVCPECGLTFGGQGRLAAHRDRVHDVVAA